MSNAEETAKYHAALLEKKIILLLKLSEEIVSLSQTHITQISAALVDKPAAETRIRVLLGLGLKTFRAFECLVIDAQQRRAEAHHHLKSQIESFIYLLWVRKDTRDTNARLVWARGSDERRKYFAKQNDKDSGYYTDSYGDNVENLTRGIESEWETFKSKKLETLAGEANADQYYQRIYRLACDPSHIADVTAYMPLPDEDFSRGPYASAYWAYLALNYGCHIMFSLLEVSEEFLQTNLASSIAGFKSGLDSIVSMT